MRKCIKVFILLFILLFTANVKAREYTEAEYKELGIKRAYIVCDYVFNLDSGYNPTLKDFMLASQSCPIDNVTIFEYKYAKDINGNDTKTYTELLNNRKYSSFQRVNIKSIYNNSVEGNPAQVLDNTETNINYELDTTPYDETKYKTLNIARSYIVGAYVFKLDGSFNPTLKDLLLANQSNPKGETYIYEIKYAKDINGNDTKTYTELLSGNKLNEFPQLNLRYYFWGNIIPNNHSSESKRDLMTSDEITYTLGSFIYNGENPNIRTAQAKSNLPITYKVYGNTSCTGDELTEYKNAGNYSVLASTEGNTEYAKATKCVSFTITPKVYNQTEFTITLDQEIYNYDGQPKTPTPVVKHGNTVLVNNTDYVLSYQENIEIGENAQVKVTFKNNYSGEAIKKFKISNTDIVIRKTDTEYTYDGNAKTIELTVVAPQNVDIVYGDSDCSENECTLTAKPTFTEANTYVVYYKASATGYSDNYGSVTVTINKADDTIEITERTGLVYNGEGQPIYTPTVTSDSVYNIQYFNASSCSEVVNGVAECEGAGATLPVGPTDAGNYVAKIVTTGDNSNYNVAEKYVRHNIAPKNGSETAVSFVNDQVVYTYTGDAIEPVVIVHDSEVNANLTIGTDYEVAYSNNVYTSTEGNKAKATITYKGNYTGSQIAEFTIVPESMVVTVSSVTTTYDGQPHSVSVTAPSGSTIQYSPGNQNSYSATNPTYTNVGTYTVWVKVEKEGYTTIEQPATVTISKADDVVNIDPVNTTYTGNAIVANSSSVTTSSNTSSSVTYEYYKASDCTGTGNNFTCDSTKVLQGAPTNAGQYYVKVTSNTNNQNPNYNSGYCYQAHVIQPKGATGLTSRLLKTSYDYDPNNTEGFTPDVEVIDPNIGTSGYTLVKGTDYTVSYENDRINASYVYDNDHKPKVVVTFVGNYGGSWNSTFVIDRININKTITTDSDSTGTKVRIFINKDIPNIVVKYGDTASSLVAATRMGPDATIENHTNDYYWDSETKTACGASTIYYEISGNPNYNPVTGQKGFEVSCGSMAVSNQTLVSQGDGNIPVLEISTVGGSVIPKAERTLMFGSVEKGTRNNTSNSITCSQDPTDYTVPEDDLVEFTGNSWAICFMVTKDGYNPLFAKVNTTN